MRKKHEMKTLILYYSYGGNTKRIAEMIQKERREILEAGQDDIRRLSKVVEAVLKADQLCVIGSEEKIEEERNLFGTVTSF